VLRGGGWYKTTLSTAVLLFAVGTALASVATTWGFALPGLRETCFTVNFFVFLDFEGQKK